MKESKKQVRCAVYTRKSSDEGLGQEFNSLDAQRESGEAFIASRKGEGWVCLPERYDDGGFSGGNMDRPGLTSLLEAVKHGEVDVVVVYKLDRLTRSIRDFAAIVETLESQGVAIASVTQPINSGDLMGRLMVHILLSFAQFERELASERTRDKIAASRKRGIWTGGRPVLGYDFAGSKLVVNEPEAEQVRRIFATYIEHQSMRAVLAKLQTEGVTNKRWTTTAGEEIGGNPFSLCTLSGLLSNVLYIGRVPHKGTSYEGQHDAIIDPKAFQRVQEILQENRSCGASMKQNRFGGLLKGLLKCSGCGCPMVHTSTTKSAPGGGGGKVVYRYYTCRSPVLIGKSKCKAGTIPAEQIESFVIERVREELDRHDIAGLVYERLRNDAEAKLGDLEALHALERIDQSKAYSRRDSIRADELEENMVLIDREIAATQLALPTRSEIEAQIAEFKGMWRSLTPTERASMIAHVVKAVRFDAKDGQIAIEWHDTDREEEAA